MAAYSLFDSMAGQRTMAVGCVLCQSCVIVAMAALAARMLLGNALQVRNRAHLAFLPLLLVCTSVAFATVLQASRFLPGTGLVVGGLPAAIADSEEDKVKPERGRKLEFLADVPEFRDLDLSVTKEQLKQHIATFNLIWRATDEDSSYMLFNPKGECVIVMFRDGKCGGIQRMRADADFGGDWGEPLLGLRMRLSAPAGNTYRRGERLPLVIEMQNVTDKAIRFSDLHSHADFKVFTHAGDWLGIARRDVAISPWEGARGSLAPHRVLRWQVDFGHLRLNKPVAAGSTVQVRVGAPRQIEEPGKLPRTKYSKPVLIKLMDAPPVVLRERGDPPTLTSRDVTKRWTKDMNVVYREVGGLSLRSVAIQIDGQGNVTMLNGGGVERRKETRFGRERLDALAARFRQLEIWDLAKVKWRLANPDEGEVRISLTYGSAGIIGDYGNGLVRDHKTLAALKAEMLAVMEEAAKAAAIDRKKRE